MKILEVRRHSDKSGEHLSDDGLKKLGCVIANPGDITDIFCGSAIDRTAESALAVVVYGGVKPQRLHKANPGLGNKDQLQKILDVGFVAARGEKGDNIAAARECLGDDYQQFCEELLATIQSLMDEMPEGARGLVFGHSPFIEMAVDACKGEKAEKELGSCEGFRFIEDGGSLKCSKIK